MTWVEIGGAVLGFVIVRLVFGGDITPLSIFSAVVGGLLYAFLKPIVIVIYKNIRHQPYYKE